MRYSVAIPSDIHDIAASHLIRKDGQEDVCFALWYPSAGEKRTSALIYEILLPRKHERKVHGNASFYPAYLERALEEALSKGAGIAFMHSHPAVGWQGMSQDDYDAELRNAAAIKAATGLPFVGLTVGKDGSWSSRFWIKTTSSKYKREWCESVRVVGDNFHITFMDKLLPAPPFEEEIKRTLSAWGYDKQAILARLKIGIVGAGSVGSIIAEGLARIGCSHVKLLDFDSIEKVNLDRSFHARKIDAMLRRSKVKVISKQLKNNATVRPFIVEPIEWSVVEEEGFRKALDCDILFSCVDRPWARHVLNFIAYAHLIPVVDGGIMVDVKPDGTLRGADWKAHIVGPNHICLACLKQYDSELVSVERDGYLENPTYIKGLPKNHPLKRNENVIAFSLSTASLQLLQMLSMVIAPSDIGNIGEQNYHFVTGKLENDFGTCNSQCLFPPLVAKGDNCGIKVTGKHLKAELARAERSKWNQIKFLWCHVFNKTLAHWTKKGLRHKP